MKLNGKLMKQTVTISNQHLQEIFYRLNLPETSVTNETSEKKMDIFYRNNWNNEIQWKLMKCHVIITFAMFYWYELLYYRKLMKQTVTINYQHLQEIFYRLNLPETAETSVTNEMGIKKWTSSLETTETMKLNGKLMKRTVTISNQHLKRFFIDTICRTLL